MDVPGKQLPSLWLEISIEENVTFNLQSFYLFSAQNVLKHLFY